MEKRMERFEREGLPLFSEHPEKNDRPETVLPVAKKQLSLPPKKIIYNEKN
jgi:hypothetical protein